MHLLCPSQHSAGVLGERPTSGSGLGGYLGCARSLRAVIESLLHGEEQVLLCSASHDKTSCRYQGPGSNVWLTCRDGVCRAGLEPGVVAPEQEDQR